MVSGPSVRLVDDGAGDGVGEGVGLVAAAGVGDAAASTLETGVEESARARPPQAIQTSTMRQQTTKRLCVNIAIILAPKTRLHHPPNG